MPRRFREEPEVPLMKHHPSPTSKSAPTQRGKLPHHLIAVIHFVGERESSGVAYHPEDGNQRREQQQFVRESGRAACRAQLIVP